jgi:hypothetical protein
MKNILDLTLVELFRTKRPALGSSIPVELYGGLNKQKVLVAFGILTISLLWRF